MAAHHHVLVLLCEGEGETEGGREGGRERVVYEDTVHITALIIHLSLTITPDTHTVFLMSELDPLFKEGDAVTFPTIYRPCYRLNWLELDTIGN